MSRIALVVFFCAMISAPYINMVFDIVPDLELKEKRRLAQKPTFQASELYNYFDYYQAYFEDNYGFRNYLVKANLLININLFDKSPMPARVILGKDDWLFLGRSEDLLLNRKRTLSDIECKKFIEGSLLQTTRQFAAHGIKYYVMLVPEKSYVYPEYLPKEYDHYDVRKYWDELIDYLKQNKELNIVSVHPTLLKTKKESAEIIYQTSDTHWNDIGAFRSYQTFLEHVKKDFPNEYRSLQISYSWSTTPFDEGDLRDMLSLPSNHRDHYYRLTPKDSNSYFYDKGLDVQKFEYSFKNEQNKNKPSILMLHDSFGEFFKPWLINDFYGTQTSLTKYYEFSIDQILSGPSKPEIVLHEMVPRNSVLPLLYK